MPRGVFSHQPNHNVPARRSGEARAHQQAGTHPRHTSVQFGARKALRVFRELALGVHPEIETASCLASRGYRRGPPLAGWMNTRPAAPHTAARPPNSRVEHDFVFVATGTDPRLPWSDRRTKRSPLVDVAPPVRSFGYAAAVGLLAIVKQQPANATLLRRGRVSGQESVASARVDGHSPGGARTAPVIGLSYRYHRLDVGPIRFRHQRLLQ